MFKQCTNFKEVKDENTSEIKLLKVSIKNSNDENKKLKKDLSEANKVIKTKDKMTFNIQQILNK